MSQVLKIILIIAAILVVGVLVLAWYLKNNGEKCDPNNQGYTKDGEKDSSCGSSSGSNGNTDEAPLPTNDELKNQVLLVSKLLYDAMKDWNTFTGTKDDAWKTLIGLSDAQIKAVYLYFNARYGEGDTLTQWIKDENYYDYISGVKQLTLDKLANLNLV